MAEQATGLTLPAELASRVQLLDVNGDSKLDLFYAPDLGSGSQRYPLRARKFASTNFGTEIDVGNSTSNTQNPATTPTFLIDATGDGVPDLVRFSGSNIGIAIGALANGGNDLISRIVNGLGAVHAIGYAPLGFSSVYGRAFDGPSKTWGRGSPVFDVFSAMWVVRTAGQSSPIAGNALMSSSVRYYYSGARMQAGGRGFLGFQMIRTEDIQNYLVTTTEYQQDYPYLGRPKSTVVEKLSAPVPDPCSSNPNAAGCYREPPSGCGPLGCPIAPGAPGLLSVGGQVLNDSATVWTTQPAFNPATWQPVHVYASSTDEQKFDLATPDELSFQIGSTFLFDSYGNMTSSTVTSRHVDESSSLVTDETKTTTNIYGCTVTPPTPTGCGIATDTERRRLGRLSISTVDSSRPGTTNVRRRASFEYDPTRLLLTAEIQGPYLSTDGLSTDQLKRLNMRTDYVLDADGNRIAQYQCDTTTYPDSATCTSLASFQQQQWESDPTRFQRYGKTVFEASGRFPLYTLAPFFNPLAPNKTDEDKFSYTGVAVLGTQLQSLPSPNDTIIVNRNAFGDPFNRISSTDMITTLAYGSLGRARFETSTTGNFAVTTYSWCQDVGSGLIPDVPAGAPRANCPLDAIFRVATSSVASTGASAGKSASPTRFAYFDRLGREVLATTRIYQKSGSSLNRWTSVATSYDEIGRTKSATVAYFSADPTLAQSSGRAGTPLGATPARTVSSYDAVGRPALVDHPEQTVNGASSTLMEFDKLKTQTTNPRNFGQEQFKNALDELIKAEDSAGFQVNYERNAVGDLTAVRRTPNNGDSSGIAIVTTMSYDRLGRKTAMTDPDKGSWTYAYNALGELVEQIDAKGQTQRQYRDALGRVHKRTETRQVIAGQTAEPTAIWVYDTATRPDLGTKIKGMPSSETTGIGSFTREYRYDVQGRLTSTLTTLESKAYTERITYDDFGRIFQHFAPDASSTSTTGEQTEYSSDGYPILTRETTGSRIYNEVLALTARGQVRQEQFHDDASFATTRTFDDNTGRMLNVVTNGSGGTVSVQNWQYTYDKLANVTSRWNLVSGYDAKEDFAYDGLDRLQTVTLSRLNGIAVNQPQTISYDQLGNLKTRTTGSLVSTWVYGAAGTSGCARSAGPHAVASFGTNRYCYDANGNQTEARYSSSLNRLITYTGYDLPETIVTNGYPGATTVGFRYATDRSMWKRTDNPVLTDTIFCSGFEAAACGGGASSAASTTYYVGNLEIRESGGVTTTKRYVGAYLVITTTSTAPTPQYAYLFRDALGSLDAITSQTGAIQQRLSFDAWGKRRYADTPNSSLLWSPMPPSNAANFDTSRTRQGYTGHQQLDGVGLVHMKGRLYDPELGRFIQADGLIEPHATQGLNRYSYVLNNPLTLTDPTGQLSTRQWVAIAIAVVAAYFGQYYYAKGMLEVSFAVSVTGGFLSAYVATGSWRAGLWGAFAAGVFWGIGSGFSGMRDPGTGVFGSGFTSGQYAAKVAAHGAAGGVLAELQGGNFGNGFIAAGASQATAPMIESMPDGAQFVATAIVGGTVSEVTGGSFANGAVTSAFSYALSGAIRSRSGDGREAITCAFGECPGEQLIAGPLEYRTPMRVYFQAGPGITHIDGYSWLATWSGAAAGERAAQYWADLHMQTGNPLYAVLGIPASLWTPDTALETAFTLGTAGGSSIGFRLGREITFGKNFRLAPFGNRTKHRYGELPHYHRRGTDPMTGQTLPGQGIGRHRPWETKSTDRSWWDRL